MKKTIAFLITLIVLSMGTLNAQDRHYEPYHEGFDFTSLPLGMTVDVSIPLGSWANDGFNEERTAFGQRIGFLMDLGYKPLPFLTAGGEVGVRFFYFDIRDPHTGEQYGFFLDLPLRAFVRFGKGEFFLQPFGGYYFSFWNSYLQGAELGIKVSFYGVIIEFSHIFGDIINAQKANWDQKDYWRLSAGYRFRLQE